MAIARELDRSSRPLGKPGWRFLALAAVIAVAGTVLIVVGSGAADAIGIVLVALALLPAFVGVGLLASGLVAWWAARRKPFA